HDQFGHQPAAADRLNESERKYLRSVLNREPRGRRITLMQFQPGNQYGHGRKGARNRISAKLLETVFNHSNEPAGDGKRTKFEATLEVMFKQKPLEYAKCIASLLPKQVDISDPTVADLNMEQTDAMLADLRRRVLAPV